MLEKGIIYQLKLSKKIEEHGLLIFNFGDNTSARLHKRNLSNHPSLSQKMFDLFEIGQEVTALVTEFNIEKRYYELSTKAFRNALDDALPFNLCVQIINNRYGFYSDIHNDHLIQYRKILDRLRGDLASTGLTFLYELLQNAVDHPNNNFQNELSVHFEVFHNYLLLKHNGALFTENNFKSICGILFGEQSNEVDVNRIGYKGIGFKSVFRHTDNVYVRSGNFSFSFKKDIDNPNKPWEVMPIFQNEIQKIDEIPQFDFFNSPVAFAFEFSSEIHKSNVIDYLEELAENPYLLIFLDKLKSLRITIPVEEYLFEKEVDSDNTIRLKVNNSVHSEWSSFSKTFPLEDENIISELLDENNKSIPDHFRQFRAPKVDILVPSQQIENAINLFAYLPLSSTQYKLEYIVNADFIPNLDRSNIIDLSYNFKLAEFAGLQVLKACESFALNREFQRIKQLFPIYENESNRFKNTLQQSFLARVERSALFPSHYDNNHSYPIADILVDSTGIYEVIPETLYSIFTNTSGKPLDINSGLETEYLFLHSKLSLGSTFEKDNLVYCLKNEEFKKWLKQPQNNFLMISHFYSREDLKDLIKTENVILNSNNDFSSSKSLYKDIPQELIFMKVNVVNFSLLMQLDENDISIKFLEFEPIGFYRKNILGREDAVNSILTSEKNLLDFWKFVYNHWDFIEKEKEIIDSLKKILVLIKPKENVIAKFVSACYLPREFNNEGDIETILNSIGNTDARFISEKYIFSDEYKVDKWRQIFKKLEAKIDLQSVIFDLIPKLSSIDEQKHFEIGKQIFRYWNRSKGKETQLSIDQVKLISEGLKIMCLDENFRQPSECVISDHYNNNQNIAAILPKIIIENQISNDYGNQIQAWKEFFVLIGCIELSNSQDIFSKKLKCLIKNQEVYKDSEHFEILQAISLLYDDKKNNNFSFDPLAGLHLKTNTDEWLLPNQIHFSSVYKPKLDLQKDEDLAEDFIYLNENYIPKRISWNLLNKIGVSGNFKFELHNYLRYDEFENQSIKNELKSRPKFKSKVESYGGGYSQPVQQYAGFKNHVICYPILSTTIVQKHNKLFFDEVFTLKEEYFNKTSITFYERSIEYCDNALISFIKENPTIENRIGVFERPDSLFSVNLEKYIDDASLLPKYDYSKQLAIEKSLEETIGIQQKLSANLCIQLLSSECENKISLEEIERLEIVKILENNLPLDFDGDKIFLLNENLEWKPINELLACSSGEDVEIEPSQHLHQIFYPIATNFGVPELSESTLFLKTNRANPNVNDEIKSDFNNKAKYLAYKLDQTNYPDIETEFVEKIKQFNFYEVESIEKVFPENNPIYKAEFDFYHDTTNNKVYYTGYWKTNSAAIDFLFDLIEQDKIKKVWFENVMNRWNDNKIIEILEGEFGETPWSSHQNNRTKKENSDFWQELEDLNLDLNIKSKIKQKALDFGGNLDVQLQYQQNLLAKIALLKHLGKEDIIEEVELNDYNNLKIGGELYKVYSSKSEFAHIQPTALLMLKDSECKIAIYYGAKNGINLFTSIESLFELNENHIFEYQTKGDITKLLEFLDTNNINRYRYLLINPYIIKSYKSPKNKKVEIDNDASNLI